MFSNYLSSIENVSIYAIIGLILFLGLFLFIIYKTIRTNDKILWKMKNLPLEDDEESKNTESENEKE